MILQLCGAEGGGYLYCMQPKGPVAYLYVAHGHMVPMKHPTGILVSTCLEIGQAINPSQLLPQRIMGLCQIDMIPYSSSSHSSVDEVQLRYNPWTTLSYP